MFLSAYLIMVLAQPVVEGFRPQNTRELTTFAMKNTEAGWVFDWRDGEERVRGTVSPPTVSALAPVSVSLALGAFASGDLNVPVSVELRSVDGNWRELLTIQPPPTSPRVWVATFTPPAEGTYELEVAWRSSRRKSIHGELHVSPERVSRRTGTAVALGAILLAVVYGLFSLFKKNGTSSEASGSPPPS